MVRVSPLVAACLVAGSAFAAEAEFRTWTDVQQRQIEASFERTEADQVVLKLRSGDTITVPLKSLSEADRKWIEQPTAGALTYNGPPAEADWPRTVSLKELPEVTVVREDPETKEFVYESEHYEFVCDSKLSANLMREISRVFEATWLVNCLLPLDLRPVPEGERKKFLARIFTNKSDYRKAGGTPGSAGVYSPSKRALMVPLDSLGVKMVGSRVAVDYVAEDYKTLIHEITHQMMNHWLSKIPVWFTEGAAEYVELAPYDNGRFSFLKQDNNLKQRLTYLASPGEFPMVPLERLFNITNKTWDEALARNEESNTQSSGTQGSAITNVAWRNYASALVLTYYFYHIDDDGKGTHIKDYLREIEAIKSRDKKGLDDAVSKHLIRGRSYAEIEKDLQRGLRREGIAVKFTD